MSEKASYGQILKSSSIMGGAAVIIMILGMVKTKFAAILIGTIGVGLVSNFFAIQSVIGTIAGLGIQASAVRDVASAIGNNDEQSLGRIVLTLRRICWLTGMMGMLAMIAVAPLVSQWTFGNDKYALDIAALGILILFANLAGGNLALLQGTRRIGTLARVNIIGAMFGTVTTIGLYYSIGLRGIVPALIMTALIQYFVSWRYSRLVPVITVSMTWKESFHEAGDMVRLGLAMMWAALLGSVVIYATNALITQQISLEAVGVFAAAYAVSGMLVNFILNAMGSDYYPRLTGLAHDKEAVNRLVNEQTEVALLLAIPGLLGVLSLSPWIIQLLYSSAFLPATDLLQWFILGCLGKIIQWPMGFIQLALNKGAWFTFTQTLFNCVLLLFIWVGLMFNGLEGVSIAYFLQSLVSLGVILLVASHLTGFRWTKSVLLLLMISIGVVLSVFIGLQIFPKWVAMNIGVLVTIVSTLLSIRALFQRVGPEHRIVRAACRVPGVHKFICVRSRE